MRGTTSRGSVRRGRGSWRKRPGLGQASRLTGAAALTSGSLRYWSPSSSALPGSSAGESPVPGSGASDSTGGTALR